jgi:N-acetylglucosaminyldiphosphoundecaprenol N-acetyl-beta-D-mannosaminyltransferase
MTGRDAGVLLGVPVDRKSLERATLDAISAINGTGCCVVFACANAHALEVAQRDLEYKSALRTSELVVADGAGVTLMARIAGVRVGPRITGHDYFVAVMNALQHRGAGRVFFFGSSREVLELIATRFHRDFPALQLCGTLSPPFGDWGMDQNTAMVREINGARPDVLWIGMTAPKQEKWVAANRRHLCVPVIGSIGAVFDFYAGTVSRAPQWIRRLGFEWLYRLAKEPRRLWRRYLVSSPKFIALVIWHHLLGIRRDEMV